MQATVINNKKAQSEGVFKEGATVVLTSVASGKNLRILANGSVDGQGGWGQFVKFRVSHNDAGQVRFQSIHNPQRFVNVKANGEVGWGPGMGFTTFKVDHIKDDVYCFHGKAGNLGVLPNGNTKNGKNTGKGPHGQFRVHNIAPFKNGQNVVLQSSATGKNVQLKQDGSVAGMGARGPFAVFTVHRAQNGTWKFQKKANPKQWLRIGGAGNFNGGGVGGQWCQFVWVPAGGNKGHLRSAHHLNMGQQGYAGIKPNGEAKPSKNTSTGAHGTFTVHQV